MDVRASVLVAIDDRVQLVYSIHDRNRGFINLTTRPSV